MWAQGWLDNLVSKLNRRKQDKVNEERAALIPLPASRGVDYDEIPCPVSSTSTIIAKRVTYTVPSGLLQRSISIPIVVFISRKNRSTSQR